MQVVSSEQRCSLSDDLYDVAVCFDGSFVDGSVIGDQCDLDRF